jgi:hypothetical protein
VAKTRLVSQWKPLSNLEQGICARFAEARQVTGLSQVEWGRKHGFSRDEVHNVELRRVPLKWHLARRLIAAHRVNPRWLAEGFGPTDFSLVLAVTARPNARKNALFSEVYEAEVKPLMDELLSEALANELASVGSMLERGPKAGPARAVLQDSTMRLLDLALQMPDQETFRSAISDLQQVAFKLARVASAQPDQTAAVIAARIEELCSFRERERMARRTAPEEKQQRREGS